jgi:hypothetical protein
MKQANILQHPEFIGDIGIGRADITPSAGIYSKLWGASLHDTASAVHKPLFADCILFRSKESDLDLYIITVDLSWWRNSTEEREIRSEILRRSQLEESQLILHLSHSHSAPSTSLENINQTGGQLIPIFRDKMLTGFAEAIDKARLTIERSCLTWAAGKCQLAFNRDQIVKTDSGTNTVVGLNLNGDADDTLLVGRVVDAEDNIRAVLVNYACHPVSLGSGNSKISPDYVGRMREIVESELKVNNKVKSKEGICLFFHGASGELNPRVSYSSHTEDADNNGLEIGYAVLSALVSMLPAQKALAFDRIEQSGAPLGYWALKPNAASSKLAVETAEIELSYFDLPTLQELDQLIEQADEGYALERLKRRRSLRQDLGNGNSRVISFPIWQVGNAVFVALNAEAYSSFQTTLRQRFPDIAVVCMNISNGYLSYLPSQEAYEIPELYQVKVAVFERGCLEKTIDVSCATIERLIK